MLRRAGPGRRASTRMPIDRAIARRGLLAGLGAVALAGTWRHPVRAQATDTRPLRVVLNGPPGGLIDVAARAIGDALQANLAVPVLIDARPGGNGVVGGSIVTGAAPDSRTVLMTVSAQVAMPHLIKLPYDVLADFTPIARVGVSPAIVCVHPSLPVTTLPELVDYARARPGKLNYLNPANGTTAHLVPEILKLRHRLDIASIPYKGLPPGVLDLVAGRLELGVISTGLVLGHIAAGALKPIAVGAPARLAALPAVATMSEQGFDAEDLRTWIAVFGPPRMAAAAINGLSRALMAAVDDIEARRRMALGQVEPWPLPAAPFVGFVREEHRRYGELIARLDLRADGG